MADRRVAGQLRSLTSQQVPGVAIAIAGPEGLREEAAAGYADLTARVAASADMVCPWFSMTKIVTATLAMRLVDRGLVDMDRPVADRGQRASEEARPHRRGLECLLYLPVTFVTAHRSSPIGAAVTFVDLGHSAARNGGLAFQAPHYSMCRHL